MSKLTAAYIAIGYINQHANDCVAVQEHYDNGQLDLIANMVHYAEYLDALAEAGYKLCNGSPGVFDYEVTESFGPWFGQQVLTLEPGHVPSVETVCEQLRIMTFEFFHKGWVDPTSAWLLGLGAVLGAVPLPTPYGAV